MAAETHERFAANQAAEVVAAATAVLRHRREPLVSVLLAMKRTGLASYLSQKITVAVKALCDSLWRAHDSKTATVLRPTPEDFDTQLRAGWVHGRSGDGGGGGCDGRDGSGGGGGGDHDRRGGGEDRDRRGSGSGMNNHGGSSHSGCGGGNGRRRGTTQRGKGEGGEAGILGSIRAASVRGDMLTAPLGPNFRSGGRWCTSPGRQGEASFYGASPIPDRCSLFHG